MRAHGSHVCVTLLIALALSSPLRSAFIRSDFNSDSRVDIADPVTVLEYLFQGSGSSGCLDAGDANDDGSIDISDAVFTLSYLFLGGAAPALPFPGCGEDPTSDSLDCTQSAACEPIACGASTPAVTEGPYYKAGSPERSSLLETGLTGTRLLLTGRVLSPDCQPIASAWLDFWHANASGVYDNTGYTLRGHQFTDSTGHYTLETIVPGIYPGRTEHIHVKVKAPDGPTVTSQLFFPFSTHNDGDGIFLPELEMSIQETTDGLLGSFDFVVQD